MNPGALFWRMAAVVSFAVSCGAGSSRPMADAASFPDGWTFADPPEGQVKLGSVEVYEMRVGAYSAEETQWGAIGVGFYDVPYPDAHTVALTDGDCVLRTYSPISCDACDGVCVAPNRCAPYPQTVSGGIVSLTGLNVDKTLSTLRPQFDGDTWQYLYGLSGMGLEWTGPADVFAPGALITASTTGATVPAVELQAVGVAAVRPSLPNGILRFVRGRDYAFTWTPAAGDARVDLVLNSSNDAHGAPLPVIIQCEARDAAGKITIPRAMIDAFPVHLISGCVHHDCPLSVVRRWTRGVATVPGGYVELVVADVSYFELIQEAP